MKRLLIDCSSGISGEMFLGAMTGVGCDFAPLEDIFRTAGVELSIKSQEVIRASGPGVVTVINRLTAQPLLCPADLAGMAARLDLSEAVRERSLKMLSRFAEAWDEAHGAATERGAHFYEACGLKTLVCVVGAAWSLERLEVSGVICRPLPWFGGFADSETGRLALPAPVTLVLLKGKPFYESGATGELITPIGALLLDTLVDNFVHSEQPEPFAHMAVSMGSPGVFEKSGLGYCGREPDENSDWPGRGLRLHLFSALPAMSDEEPYHIDEIYEISCRADDLTGEEIGNAITMLMQAGALDVLWLPGLAKKNRPGGELRVLCMIDMLPIVEKEVFKCTHSFDIGVSRHVRVTMPRKGAKPDSPWDCLDGKEYKLLDQTFTKAEYDALTETAAREGIGLPALRILAKKDK